MRLRIRTLAFAAFLAIPSLSANAADEKEEIGPIRGPYIVVDADSGRIIEEFDAVRPWYPASTTKLMTIYVTFRAIEDGTLTLQSPVLYSKNAAAAPPSKMGFPAGTTLSIDDALKIMMVKSANDIAVAVAETVAGSVEKFAERMNEEARRLGMTRSHFANPHGLPDKRQVTSVRDMALLARVLLTEFSEYRDYYKVPAIQFGDKVLKNYNTLLARYPGANGMKTGFICSSGYNLVASAERGGREVIAIVFGSFGGKARAEHAAALLNVGLRAPGDRNDPTITLTEVTDGSEFTTPLDMRPYICGDKRAEAMSEANEDGGGEERGVPLGPPVYLGPPVRVSVKVPPELQKEEEVASLARLPRPRPTREGEEPRASIADAFAPVDEKATPSEAAIDAAAGAAAPLGGVQPE
jgi:D-alanyl-D-alanine carboxypeptidase